MNIKKILCPVDLESASLNAINYAASLAKKAGGALTLLTVLPETTVLMEESPTSDAMLEKKNEIEDQLDEVCTEVQKNFHIKCDILVHGDRLDKAVADVAGDSGFDLVVIGTDGESGIGQLLFGSNAANVMDKMDIPILIVPIHFTSTNINNITFASDYQENEHIYIRQLADFAKLEDASITVLHADQKITDKKEERFKEYREKLINYLPSELNLKFSNEVVPDTMDGIHELLERNDSDILAMLTRHRNLIEKFFHISMSKAVVTASSCPVLIFHQ